MRLINQLSKETGIPIGTIRFYEKSGLISGIKPKEITTNNYIYYSDEIIERLIFIKDAKAVGFTLKEISEIINAWFGEKLNKEEKINIITNKLFQIDEKIKELKLVKKQVLTCLKNIEKN